MNLAPNEHRLRQLVAQFWKLREGEIDDALAFTPARLRGMSSTRFLTFIAAIESQLGVRVADPAAVTSYGALRSAIGAPVAAPQQTSIAPQQSTAATQQPRQSPTGDALAQLVAGMALGNDVDEIANYPKVADYAKEPFYTQNFTAAEIAYCARQTDPRPHFAARHCAKEALLKCGAPVASLRRSAIEIASDAAGAPSLRILDDQTRAALGPARILVSLSHGETVASAVVVLVRLPG